MVREMISFALTIAGLGMLIGLAGNDDLSIMQGTSNTVDNVLMPLCCLALGWLIGKK